MNAPLTVGYHSGIFQVIGLPVLVEWNKDDRRIYVADQFVERDVDVFSDHFFNDLNRQMEALEKHLAELMAEPI